MPGCPRPGRRSRRRSDPKTAALRTHAEQLGLDVPAQWLFEDDGHSGASLVRPALERLRDLVCQVPVDVLLVYSPDRLARNTPTRRF
jgi:site-specific DNA recombinase